MAKPLLTDEKWNQIQHLFPAPPPRPKGGRKRVDYRRVLTGILFIRRTGIPWHDLPLEMGCGSGMTCWRRLRDWQAEGLWQRLLEHFVHELKQDGRLADDRLIMDASLVAAKKGAKHTGPNPCDRAKPGSKHHLITDGQGVPLGAALSVANVPEGPTLPTLPTLVEAAHTVVGTPQTNRAAYADKAYDSQGNRVYCRLHGLKDAIAERGKKASGLGRRRWVIERTFAWLKRYRRLATRYERRADIHLGLLLLGCALIASNFCR